MLDTKKFQRKIENFVCDKCGHKNIGDGYTNHCVKCLYSKHVDENPGDRKSGCWGLMEPIETFKRDGVFYIKHKCQKCGHEKNNKLSENDSFEEFINISSKEAKN